MKGFGKFVAAIGASLVGALAAAPAAKAEQISVTHWGVLMYGAPYAVAMEKGFFKEAGVDIDGILTSKGGGTTMRNVLAGGLPYGEVALSAVVAAAREGIDLRIVNGGAQTVGEILWATMPDSPVKTIEDLKGRKMAFTSPKSVTDMVSIMVLEAKGIPLNEVERVAVGGIGNGLTALEQGGVDATPIMDPVWAKSKGKYRALFWAKDILPPMMQSVGVTTAEFAESNPDKLRAIIQGRRKGVEFIYANPDESAEIFAKHYNIDPEVARTAINNMIEMKYWSAGELDLAAMDNMVKGLQIVGEVDGPVDWSKLVDEQFLK